MRLALTVPPGMANLHYRKHRRSQIYRGFDGQAAGSVGTFPSWEARPERTQGATYRWTR
jgi:hypothetical protein